MILIKWTLFLLPFSLVFSKNIGLLINATGKYINFANTLIESAEQFFCQGHHVTYFVFTDASSEQYLKSRHVHYVFQQKLGWPYDTMMRFQIYFKNRDLYQELDYLFACDADMLFVGDVGNEIFGHRVATLHPGFYNKKRAQFTYETRKESTAFISNRQGKHYFCGGFWGAERREFLRIAQSCSQKINEDLHLGIIAKWHDESHWNRYCVDHPPTLILSPAYCHPGWNWIKVSPKLHAIDKELFGGYDAIRN